MLFVQATWTTLHLCAASMRILHKHISLVAVLESAQCLQTYIPPPLSTSNKANFTSAFADMKSFRYRSIAMTFGTIVISRTSYNLQWIFQRQYFCWTCIFCRLFYGEPIHNYLLWAMLNNTIHSCRMKILNNCRKWVHCAEEGLESSPII